MVFWTIWQDDIDDWHLSSWSQSGSQVGDCLLPAQGGPWHIQDNGPDAQICGATEKWPCMKLMAEVSGMDDKARK